MYKVLIWGCGLDYNRYINVIKYREMLGEIKVIGITGKDKLYTCLDGYPFIQFNDIERYNIDYIIVTSERYYNEISIQAYRLGFGEGKLILARAFCLPEFRFGKYIKLLQSKVSIISNNCWGGITYHALGMKFLSPFVNMFESDQDYLRLLGRPQYYLQQRLKFKEFRYNELLKQKYPLCELGDIELHFNHYANMEDVEQRWYERIERINWDNLFIMMYTEEQEVLEKFDKLNYLKKVCFVPFKSSLQSAFFLKVSACEEMRRVPFWEIVNKTAYGSFHDYDTIELLEYGKANHGRLCSSLEK